MARPRKKGLMFFYNDVDFYQDIKIRKLIRRKGGQAATVYHILLCEIYRQGYYLDWDDDIPFIILEISGFQEDYIKEVIDYCLETGLFCRELFESDKVLTSVGIQQRYFAAGKDAKRKVEFNLPYLLVSLDKDVQKSPVVAEQPSVFGDDLLVSSEETPINTEETAVVSEETSVNPEKSTQRKEKKRILHSSSANTHTRGESAGGWFGLDLQTCTTVDDELALLRASPEWKEQLFLRFKFLCCDERKFNDYLERWGLEVKGSGRVHQHLGDAKKHFVSWMIIQEGKLNQTTNCYDTVPNNGYRSFEDIANGAMRIISELRGEGQQAPSELPVL